MNSASTSSNEETKERFDFHANRQNVYFKFLESVEIVGIQKTSFNGRNTALIPDLFLIFFFVAINLASTATSYYAVTYLIRRGDFQFAVMFLITFIFGQIINGIFQAYRYKYRKRKNVENIKFINGKISDAVLYICFLVIGLESLLIGKILMLKAFKSVSNLNSELEQDGVSIFYNSNVDLSTIKTTCLTMTVIKSIPQIYIALIYLLTIQFNETGLLWIIMLSNVTMFSFAITISLPLRDHATILKDTKFMPLILFTKFMAVMTFNITSLILFKLLFEKLQFYSFVLHGIKFFLMHAIAIESLKPCSTPPLRKNMILYSFGLAIIYMIVYVHPIQQKGQLMYYFYYCSKLLLDFAFIYINNIENYFLIVTYLMLSVAGICFLGISWGLVTILKQILKH